MIRRLLAVLLIAAPIAALADRGFFVPLLTDADRKPLPTPAQPAPKAGAACGINARFNAPHAQIMEISYLGGADCAGGWLPAASAVYAGVPAADLVELDRSVAIVNQADFPRPAPYLCAALVKFDSSSPDGASVEYSGATACEGRTRSIAHYVLRNMARCFVQGGPCIFWGPAGPLGRL
jgi:hypothetical protein